MRVDLYEGDCLDWMPTLKAGSIDMVLADLPYGTTNCSWDSVIPLEPLWAQYRRICRGPVVLFAQTPFDKVLGATGNPAMAETEARRQVGVVFNPGAVQPRTAQPAADPLSLVPKEQRSEALKEFQSHANKDKVVSAISKSFQDWRDTSVTSPARLNSTRSAISGTIMANVPGIRSDVDFKEIVEPNLPSHLDSEETLRHKEATIRQFVESKTTTPILDAHAPGWRPRDIARKDVR